MEIQPDTYDFPRVYVRTGVDQDIEHFAAANVEDGRRVEIADGFVDLGLQRREFVERFADAGGVVVAEEISDLFVNVGFGHGGQPCREEEVSE